MQEWVRQISQHQEQHIEEHHQTRSVRYDEDLELERFAFDIAETLVANMEKSAATTQKVGNKMEPRKKFEKKKSKKKNRKKTSPPSPPSPTKPNLTTAPRAKFSFPIGLWQYLH